MKFFIDTANIEEIKWANDLGVLDGVTTNPTLASKEGKKFIPLIKEIAAICKGPISAEVVSLDYDEMVKEAQNLAKIAKNINIKVPITEDGIKAIKTLTDLNIQTNATLCFSANQAILAAKAGATFVSPFIGRLDDIGHEGMEVVRDIAQVYKNYGYKTEVIVASIRHPLHVLEAAKIGADICTIPPKVIRQLLKHPLTDNGIERFLEDWKKVPK